MELKLIIISFLFFLHFTIGVHPREQNLDSDQSMYFAADACPSIGNLKETTFEPSSNTFQITCCDSSVTPSRCTRHINSCSQWQQEKLSHSLAELACQELGSDYRLCTTNELLNDLCCNKGCGSNSVKVWTNDTRTGM